MHVFEFTKAVVREPGRSVVNGLRMDAGAAPTYEGVLSEHRAYVDALAEAGLAVDILPPLEAYPDSMFVEDPALVFPEGAVLLRPGAPSRLGERDEVRGALARHFANVLELGVGEYADGGDVLVTPKTVFVGLSRRTNRIGAEALRKKLGGLGRATTIVQAPADMLHLKSAAAVLDEETIITTKAMEQAGVFTGFNLMVTPEGEEAAANLLRVNDVVLVGERYLRTAEMIAQHGFAVRLLPVAEVAMLDAGLSCMSLRWAALPVD
jgi:dimethylargininase